MKYRLLLDSPETHPTLCRPKTPQLPMSVLFCWSDSLLDPQESTIPMLLSHLASYVIWCPQKLRGRFTLTETTLSPLLRVLPGPRVTEALPCPLSRLKRNLRKRERLSLGPSLSRWLGSSLSNQPAKPNESHLRDIHSAPSPAPPSCLRDGYAVLH